MRHLLMLIVGSVLLSCSVQAMDLQKRWVYISSNMYVDKNADKVEALIDRAAKAGYTGVLFTDYKLGFWWKLSAADRWQRNAKRIRESAGKNGLEFVVCVFPFGYSGSLLYNDVNLAAGMPIRDARLIAKGGMLVPVQTAHINNGSFENFRGNRVNGVAFQDDPGKGSFIDAKVHKDGKASLRFEDVGNANKHGHGRVCFKVKVEPWQQYRLRVWMKTEKLTASQIQVLVIGGGRTLQYQFPVALQNGKVRHMGSARKLTTDWVEQRVTFNSLSCNEVNVYVGIWGGKTGKIWWDDLRIDAVPTLNVLRRDSLPLTVKSKLGEEFKEGRDFAQVLDPELGKHPWPGNYETRHDPPVIKLLPGTSIKDGMEVLLSCYHSTVVRDDQIACSLSDDNVFKFCREQVKHANEALKPDGFFMSHDEVRCGGWEPEQLEKFNSAGEVLADNMRRCADILKPTKVPSYVWSDMFDPYHNAVDNYYLINRSLKGSWEGIPKDVTIMKWHCKRDGLQFFAKRGHRQMIAAYYDGDVKRDHLKWQKAAQDVKGIIGVMYTTWRGDYSKLEEFAEVWWGKTGDQ